MVGAVTEALIERYIDYVIEPVIKRSRGQQKSSFKVVKKEDSEEVYSADEIAALEEELLCDGGIHALGVELILLSGMRIGNAEEMVKAAERIGSDHHCAVLLKGGHSVNDANDLLWADGEITWFEGKRIDNPNTHGTGCTLSSAIAANLAKGFTLTESVRRAKEYISGALAAMLDLGKGAGPMMHNFDLKSRFAEEA